MNRDTKPWISTSSVSHYSLEYVSVIKLPGIVDTQQAHVVRDDLRW